MSSIHELIHGLSAREISIVKNFLNFSNRQSEDKLSLQLFDFLLNAIKEPSDEDCCINIYGTSDDKQESFKKLKYRLKTKILDSLLIDPGDEKKGMMDEVDYAGVRVRKKSIQARLLYFSNPKSETARALLEEIIAECKKFEFYNILVEHIDIEKVRYIFKNGEKEFDKAIAEGNYYRMCADAVTKANDYYYKLIFVSEKNKKSDPATRAFLTDTITELTELVTRTKSNMIRYYLKFFEIYYYMKSKNYAKARDICSELMDIIIYSPAVKRKQRLGIVYSNLSICEIYLGNFDKALENAQKAQENFVPSSYDHSVAREQEFYTLFYSGRFNEAESAVVVLLNTTTRKELGNMRYARYNFWHSNVLFKQGKFSEAAHILNQKWEIKNDKEHWETELRILSIMTSIELDDYKTAVLKTDSLRKYIERCEQTNPVSQRNKNILRFLQQVERNRFVFDTKTETFAELSKTNEENAWQLLSWELIPFHEWVKEKIEPSLLTKMA